ncbi:MAG: LamB/YcsF family protein [Syntrophobacteraceae bacterium]
MAATIDVNCDVGESFGACRMGADGEIMPYITSANIACGFHAGDPMTLRRTVMLAARHGAAIGAHPGFPDLMGFGRRVMECSAEEIRSYVIYQIGAIQAFCTACGVRLRHVKPHGALYNMSAANPELFRAIAEATASVDPSLILVTLAGKHAELLAKAGGETGVRIAFEAFPDRAYTPDGALAPRGEAGAVIRDPERVAERAVQMAVEGQTATIDGAFIPIKAHTLCIHGDSPIALESARAIRAALDSAGVLLRPMEDVIQGSLR